jgi:4-amino-4-deoxy-L-arabinose transferase-like glycosyltransferase
MKEVFKYIGSKKAVEITFFLFLSIYLLLIFSVFYTSDFAVGNEDNYKGLFKRFLEVGYYKSTAEGTTILYNVFLKVIFFLTKDIDASFFILNAVSDSILLVFGYFFCSKVFNKKNIYFYIIVSIYLLYIINLRSYFRASNDTFLGVFIMVLLYLLIVRLYEEKKEISTFLMIGFVFAMCLAIRMTAVLLIPILILSFLFWVKNIKRTLLNRVKLVLLFFLVFSSFTALFHYPSLIEHQKLSYENKEPSNGLTWVQRNYLGLKKIERGEEKMNRDAIWKNTEFDVVEKYLKENGENSLPKSFFEVVKKDPVLLIKMTVLNFVTSIARFTRFWGFLFILSVLGVFNKKVFKKEQLPILLFMIYVIIISTVCFTFVEFRWFYGYEILIPISILLFFNKSEYNKEVTKKNILIVSSLLLVSLFNLKSIYTTLLN